MFTLCLIAPRWAGRVWEVMLETFSKLLATVFLISPLVAGFFFYKTIQLRKRCEIAHYCWQAMSDFAGMALLENGKPDERWLNVLKEHIRLLRERGLGVVSDGETTEFEWLRAQRGEPILYAHRAVIYDDAPGAARDEE